MAKKKTTKKKNLKSNSPRNLHTLISLLRSAKGLKPEVLKCLYVLLIRLCSTTSSDCKPHSSYELDNFTVKFQELREISSILLEKLKLKLEEFLSAVGDCSFSNVEGDIELLTLLLRCCIVIVPLLNADVGIAIGRSRVLLLVLRWIVCLVCAGGNGKVTIACGELVFPKSTYIGDDYTACLSDVYRASVAFSESCEHCRRLLCAMLEVSSDELLMHRAAGQLFFRANMVSSTADQLFTCSSDDGNVWIVLELLSAHFILSLSDEETFGNFLSNLFWRHDGTTRVPEMSLSSALSLLCNPVLFSAPKMFQAHFVSWLSDIIGINMSMDYIIPDESLMNRFLSAFQRSFILYAAHASSLQILGDPMAADDYFSKSRTLGSTSVTVFESHLMPATRKKVHDLIIKCDSHWSSYLHSLPVRTKSDLVAASVGYMKDSLLAFPESCRDVILSIMSCIVNRGSDVCVIASDNNRLSPQDIYLLASLLKLLSCLLLQMVRRLRTTKRTSSCREVDVIMATIRRFGRCNNHLPVQNFLENVPEIPPGKHKELEQMLLQFSGLLFLSYSMGTDFLVKDCIFLLMVILDLFILEESTAETLRETFEHGSESSSHQFSPEVREYVSSHEVGKALFVCGLTSRFYAGTYSCQPLFQAFEQRKSRKAIALTLQKMQKLDVCLNSGGVSSKRARIEEEGSVENVQGVKVKAAGKTTDGKAFLSCVFKGSKKANDLDDLADFIECQDGKDYLVWLKSREDSRQLRVAKKLKKLEKAANAGAADLRSL